MNKIKLDKDIIVDLFCYKNYTDKEIGKVFNCSSSVIGKFRRKHNIKRLYKDTNWLIKKREEGLNDTDIAKIIGCNPSTISKSFKKIFNFSKSKTSYNINNDLFSKYSKEECYWAGFILADGHIEEYLGYGRRTANTKLKIKLSKKDKSHLIKFRKFLGDENIKIVDKESEIFYGTHQLSEIKISRKSICNNLKDKYEISHSQKSTKEFISTKIPNEMLSHFIRGYFDGDGSVYAKDRSDSPGVVIVGSKKICEQLRKHFEFGYVYNDTNNLYRYSIFNKNHIKIFKDIIYKDSSDEIRLTRKYNKFNNMSYVDKRFSVKE